MEGWINIQRGWFWSKRYGFIAPGEFRYYDDQAMTKLKRTFKLKDFQIVQNRADKIIKLVQGTSEQLNIKSDLHELWYTKLIQAKVPAMDINFIPLSQAQEMIRRNSQNSNVQVLEQQNSNPNTESNPLDITSMQQNFQNQIQQQNIQNWQQPQQRRNIFDIPQNQVIQRQNIMQQNNPVQQREQQQQQASQQRQQQNMQYQQYQQRQQYLQEQQQLQYQQYQQQQQQQYQYQQQLNNQRRNINDNYQQAQQLNQRNIQNQNNVQKQEAVPEKKGIFSKIIDLFVGKKEDYYEDKFVSDLNSNIHERVVIKSKIEEIILPTQQPDLFNFQTGSDTIKYNYMQQIQLQQVFEEKKNILPIKVFFSLVLMLIIFFNLIQWQNNQLKYTFCSLVIIQLSILYRFHRSKNTASKCRVDGYTLKSLEIKKLYTVNQLLTQLKQINPNIQIFEQQKNNELQILDRNPLFQAVYLLSLKSASEMSIKIFTKNYEYMDSMIENFTINFDKMKGIWNKDIKKNHYQQRQIMISDIFEQRWTDYQAQYLVYKRRQKDPLHKSLYLTYLIIKNNWSFVYEIFALICLLLRIKDQIHDHFDWKFVSHWFLIFNYGLTFTKLTYFFENFFLDIRKDMITEQKILSKEKNVYFKNEQYNIGFNHHEVLLQNKINDIEVWFVCTSLFVSIAFRDWQKVIQVIMLPVFKTSFLSRYHQLKKIIITVPSVIVLSVVGILAGIFFSVMYVIWFITVQSWNFISFIFRGCQTRRQESINQNGSPQLKFIEAKQIDKYQEQECYICLEPYTSPNEKVYRCKNKHCYHKECILKWITSGNFSATRKCPICRIDLLN